MSAVEVCASAFSSHGNPLTALSDGSPAASDREGARDASFLAQPPSPRAPRRQIGTVLDVRRQGSGNIGVGHLVHHPLPNLRSASDLLDHLDATGVVLLRREVADRSRLGQPALLCPACGAALTVAVTSRAEAGTLGGRRAYLKHRPARRGAAGVVGAATGDHLTGPCPLARGVTTRTPGAIDAERFDGQQEGDWHAATKKALADAFRADPAVLSVAVEARVALPEGRFA